MAHRRSPTETVGRARSLLPHAELWQVYGSTETCASGTTLSPAFLEGPNSNSSADVHTSVEVRVVDTLGRPLPKGEVGEIVVRCEAVMKGYWNNPEATRQVFLDGGWLRTGDAGYFDEDDFLYIHDRIKDMIVSGAENVYPAEVENALMYHPAIADVAVIGVPDERWGEAVKAVIVLKPRQEVTQDDIIAFARGRIAGYKLPKSIDFVATLPRNASGKLLRRELRAPYWVGRVRLVKRVPDCRPRSSAHWSPTAAKARRRLNAVNFALEGFGPVTSASLRCSGRSGSWISRRRHAAGAPPASGRASRRTASRASSW